MGWLYDLSKQALIKELTLAAQETAGNKRELQLRFSAYLKQAGPAVIQQARERNASELQTKSEMKQVLGVSDDRMPSLNLREDSSNINPPIGIVDGSQQAQLDISVFNKYDTKILLDLLKNIPQLSGEEPEGVMNFLSAVFPIYELHLVDDIQFIRCLMTKVIAGAL